MPSLNILATTDHFDNFSNSKYSPVIPSFFFVFFPLILTTKKNNSGEGK